MSGNRWYGLRRTCVFLCVLSLHAVAAQNLADNTTPPPPLAAPNNAAVGQIGNNPTPVEQALTPEGVYAMELLDALKLPPASEPGQAEEVLTNLGIEPKNGWISDYPVTPAVLGELDKDISDACDQKKVSLSSDQALKRVNALKSRLGFQINSGPAVPPAAVQPPKPATLSSIYSYLDSAGARHYTDNYDSIPPEYQAQAKILSQTPIQPAPANNGGYSPQYTAVPNPSAVYDYYQTQGPPVVTYYAPPDPYYYLYSWAPYPFWSNGYYFPGYFVLNNFTRQVNYNNRPFYVSHHAGPVNADTGSYGRVGGGYGYNGAGALAGARAINSLEQNRANQTGFGGRNPQSIVNQNAMQTAPFAGHGLQNQIHNQAQYNPQQQLLQQQQYQQHLQQQQQYQQHLQQQQHFEQQQQQFQQQQHFAQQQQQHMMQEQHWNHPQMVEHNFGGGGNNFQGGGEFHGGGGFQGGGGFHGGGGFQGGGGFHGGGGGGHGGGRH